MLKIILNLKYNKSVNLINFLMYKIIIIKTTIIK